MKVVILAGGFGTRLSEETVRLPKPMVEIGGKPIVWHIMNTYAAHGYNDFLIACGYKGEVIREYFANFYLHNSDLYIDLRTGRTDMTRTRTPNWTVGCINTGLNTMTGGRLLRMREHLRGGPFMVTYGDAVGNVDIQALVRFHANHGRLATVTAVVPPARFGALNLVGDRVAAFAEKPIGEGRINGGFFVFEPGVLDYIEGDSTPLETSPLANLAAAGQLFAYRHEGFWKPMDTLREKLELESLWTAGNAPWKTW